MKKAILVFAFINLKVFSLMAQENSASNKIKASNPQSLVAVELMKLNILYVGVENTVKIAVSNSNNFFLVMAKGTIVQNENFFIIKESSPGIDTLFIYDAKNHLIDKRLFRVKVIPNPVVGVTGYFGYATVSKKELLVQRSLICVIPNFDFDIFFKITNFQMTVITDDNHPVTLESNSNLFTDEMKNLIETLPSKTKITFEYIDALGPDGQIRRLEPVSIFLK